MVAVLALSIVLLLAYIGSTWATIARKNERIAQLETVLKRRGGEWHEVPTKAEPLPQLWGRNDDATKTVVSVAPDAKDDKTDPCVMVLP